MLPLVALGWALSLFLAITHVICISFDLMLPQYAMHMTWSGLLPGINWLTPAGFAIRLVERLLYGWYAALIFGGIFIACANRSAAA